MVAIRAEIARRQELLTARETEVPENHLQARWPLPLSGGCRKRTGAWPPSIPSWPNDSCRPGCAFAWCGKRWKRAATARQSGWTARKRLLNAGYDAWSPENRHVMSRMLQNRIVAGRVRDDVGRSSSLLALLARALGYWNWNWNRRRRRFRVQRWQDGQ